MTSPKNAQDTEHGRYYTHPVTGEQLVSVTNVLGTGFAKHGLPRWYANNATDYALDNLPHVVTRSRTDRDGIRKEIAEAGDRARDGAADLGTRIHDLAEAHLTGRQIAPQDGDLEAGLYVAQYLQFLADFDVRLDRDVIAAELTVAHPGLGYAGTLDSIVMIGLDGFVQGKCKKVPDDGGRPRGMWLIDTKTSRKRASTQTYPDNALQLAALRHASEMWLPDDTVVPMQRGISGCAVLNLRQKTYKLIPLPAEMPEFQVFKNILAATKWLHGTWPGDYDHRPITPSGRFEPKRAPKPAAPDAPDADTPHDPKVA